MECELQLAKDVVQWLQFKLKHYACSQMEFAEMLLLLTQKPKLVTWVMQHFYYKRVHVSKFTLNFPPEYRFLGNSQITIPNSMEMRSCFFPWRFKYDDGHTLTMQEMAVWKGSLYRVCISYDLPFELFVKCLIWISFQSSIPDCALNPLIAVLRFELSQQSLPCGKIKVKSRIFVNDSAWNDQFCIEHVLRPQNLGQLDLEDIDWHSMLCFYESVENPVLYVTMLRLLGSVYYSLCSLFARKEHSLPTKENRTVTTLDKTISEKIT